MTNSLFGRFTPKREETQMALTSASSTATVVSKLLAYGGYVGTADISKTINHLAPIINAQFQTLIYSDIYFN
jgi:hypothetical protein